MTNTPPRTLLRTRQGSLPLPGLHDCLTMQLNVTLHRQSSLGKFVLVVRDPSVAGELTRSFSPLDDWSVVRMAALHASMDGLTLVNYLMGREPFMEESASPPNL